MAALLHDRRELEVVFAELAMELEGLGVVADVVMVGGAWLLWHAQRAATRDVDSARRLPGAIAEAIRRVGEAHDLGAHWLNDDAAPFWPANADLSICEVVYQRGPFTVRVPSGRWCS